MGKVKIRSLADIKNCPGYRFNVDPKSTPIQRVFADYQLQELTPCGIKSCHKGHMDGVMAELVDGSVTNIGHICGRQFSNFKEKTQEFRRNVRIPQLIARIGNVRNSVLAHHWKIRELAENESDLVRQRNNLFRHVPALARELMERAQKQVFVIYETRRRTEQEVTELHATNTAIPRERLLYEQVTIGRLVGLDLFRLDERLKIRRLGETVDELEKVQSLHTTKYDKLVELEGLVDNFFDDIANVERILKASRGFFSKQNFDLFSKLTLPADERQRLGLLGPSGFLNPEEKLSPKQSSKIDTSKSYMVRAMKNIFG